MRRPRTLACITSDRTGKVCVYRARESIVAKSIPADAPRAKVLGGEHAPRSHDPDEGVERGLVWVLHQACVYVTYTS